MAEVKIEISATDKASSVLKQIEQNIISTFKSGRDAVSSANDMWASAFDKLKIKSDEAIKSEKAAITSALDVVKTFASEGSTEVERATKAANAALDQLDKDNHFSKMGDSAISFRDKIKSAFINIKDHWLAVTATIAAAWITVQKAMDFAEAGARAIQSEESFRNVAHAYGEDAKELLATMRKTSAGIIDDSNLMQRAVKGLQQGLSGQQIIQILEVSRAAARNAGTDIVSAFDGITNAVANQTLRGLKMYGLIIDQKKALDDYAKAINVSTDALTEQQQTQALANAAIAEGQRQMKALREITENASEALQKFHAEQDELKETMGKGLIVAASALMTGLKGVAAAAVTVSYGFFKIAEGIGWLGSKAGITKGIRSEMDDFAKQMKIYGDAAGDTAWDLLIDGNKSLTDTFKALTVKTSESSSATKGFMKEQAAAAAQTQANATAFKKMMDDLDKMAVASEEWYNKTQLLNPALTKTAAESEKLRQEARKLKETFGDMQWIQDELDLGLKYLAAAEKVEKYRDKVKETIEGTKKQVESLNHLREAAINTYNDAIDRAQAYYDQATKANQEFNNVIAAAQSFISQYKGKPIKLFEYEDEKRNIKDLIGNAFNSSDLTTVQSTMKEIEGFLNKYRDTKDAMGFERNLKDIIGSYETLTDKLKFMRDAQVEMYNDAGDAWMESATKITQSITDIDSQINDLQNKLKSLQIILDVDPAIQAAQYLKNQIDLILPDVMTKTIQIVYQTVGQPGEAADLGGSFQSDNTMAGFHDLPKVAVGTNYVQRTGYAIVHQGEEIKPAKYVERDRQSGQVNLTLAPSIQIVGSNKDGRQLAREIDEEMADMYTHGRSRLKQVMTK
ncbi:MAG: hypothetical protein HZA14_12500 [Nitrospirae bacterium]|nr:hypothetical protein [Nitrospirota bacterium]